MYNEFRICRICLIQEDEGELIPIYEKDSELATQIFLLSGIKVNIDKNLSKSYSKQLIP